jgi:hypothetical protein
MKTLISAKEANRLTSRRDLTRMQSIIEDIERCVKDGVYGIAYHYQMYDKDKEELEAKGYKVKEDFSKNQIVTIINW